MTDRSDSLRSVRTAFTILETIAGAQPIGLSALARRLGLPKATVQRSLATLGELGWIRTDRAGHGHWELTDRARTLGDRAGDDGRLRDIAIPILGRLNAETQETVHLVVVDGREMRLIERIDTPHPLRLVRPIGSRGPLHASSGGKSVLAHLTDGEIADYLEGDLPAVAEHTITDRARLERELYEIRRRGYAVADQELVTGISAIAACVRARTGRPIGAVTVSGPSIRITRDLHESYGLLVAAAARDVTARLDR